MCYFHPLPAFGEPGYDYGSLMPYLVCNTAQNIVSWPIERWFGTITSGTQAPLDGVRVEQGLRLYFHLVLDGKMDSDGALRQLS